MATAIYRVTGMTCGHCATAVAGELDKLAGVNAVAVDIDAGQVVVTSLGVLDPEDVRAAIDEAGYALVSDAAS